MECKNCGFSNTESSRFCINCGEELKSNSEFTVKEDNTLKSMDDSISDVKYSLSSVSGIGSIIQKRDERKQERLQKEKEQNEAYKKALVDRFFSGIKCNLFLPKRNLVLLSSDGTRRENINVYNLTSVRSNGDIYYENSKENIKTVFQIVDNGVVFKNAYNGNDLRISYKNISSVYLEKVGYANYIFLKLLENQSLKIWIKLNEVNTQVSVSTAHELAQNIIASEIIPYLNEHALGMNFEESGWGLPSNKTNTTIPLEPKKGHSKECNNCGFFNQDSSKFCIRCGSPLNEKPKTPDDDTSIEKLEKITSMYEKGLLSDEEFKTMKSKIINGDN